MAQLPGQSSGQLLLVRGGLWALCDADTAHARQSPVFLKSYAPITHIHFSPSSPHRYVVTSGTRLQIYSPKTNRVVKTISRFKETAASGEIRTDGKLCVAGDEGGLVQVFDINSRAILRTIRAHKQ